MYGGKADALLRLTRAGFPVPPFFVVAPETELDRASLTRAAAALLQPTDLTVAVRSSAEDEDGSSASFAGMFESRLFVVPARVVEAIEAVRRSASSERVRAYATSQRRATPQTPHAIVQRMIDAEVAGVAFGRDPIDGSDRIVISAARGVGTAVVNGERDTDDYRVDERNGITRGAECESVLENADILRIADLVRRAGALFGCAQDVEWAMADGTLYVLQSRPVTTAEPIIWDNSNISESYGGAVLPLTYSFIRYAYAGAYRQLLRVIGVPKRTVEASHDRLENMLGSINGRVYYNLLNWYRLLALAPGFSLNRRFMETMMGVREPLPQDVVSEIERRNRAGDALALARMSVRLILRGRGLRRDVPRFHAMIDGVLASGEPLESLDLAELEREYARLENALLNNWDVPLVNDYFAMLFYGLLRTLCARWCTDVGSSLHNDLLCAEGSMISAQPALRIREMAALLRSQPEALSALQTGDRAHAEAAIARAPVLEPMYRAYLEKFGDRAQNELKLESPTLHDDPLPLIRAIARLAETPAAEPLFNTGAFATRANAEHLMKVALRGRPLRGLVFGFVLANARARLRDRENLRFERTRVFARVRRIFVAAGRRLVRAGQLEDSSDVFYVSIEHLLAAMRGEIVDLRGEAEQARQSFARYAAMPAPPNRFTALGPNYYGGVQERAGTAGAETSRIGTPCCPGLVRGRVRLVSDPNVALRTGEILVAERTDPGWIVLFPAAAAILVERGSLLSHAAIVSREMGIPSIVGLGGLMDWLRTGDLVEVDGSTGRIVLLERAERKVA